jgi:hypothetical protein
MFKKAFRQRNWHCCPQRALFQVYISYSTQKGQGSSCKMYIRGEISVEICRFLVKLQAFCRTLTRQGASDIFFTDSGTKPGARAEARFLHLMEFFIQHIHFTDATKGSAFGANTRGRPLFCVKGGIFS